MFKVGDRVKYVGKQEAELFQQVGTIVCIDKEIAPEYGVAFEKEFLGGHDLQLGSHNYSLFGHGWWCYKHELEIVGLSIVAHNAKDLYKVWGDNA